MLAMLCLATRALRRSGDPATSAPKRSGWGGLLCLGFGLVTAVPIAGAAAPEHLSLVGGFFPDPQQVAAEVRGSEPASALVRGCPGFVADSPALEVTLDDPSTPLRFAASGDAVAALIVVSPDGIHHCGGADDAGLAWVRLAREAPGSYLVWPAVDDTVTTATLSLQVSEFDFGEPSFGGEGFASAEQLVLDAPPAAGSHEFSGDDGLLILLTVSGGVSAGDAAPGCSGQIDPERPDVVVTLPAYETQLVLRVTSDADTTLIVVAPTGELFCDDDSVGHDPVVIVTDAIAGDYAVWVGIFAGLGGEDATLTVTRSADFDEPGMADVNPLLGREFATAAEAFQILMTETPLGDSLSYGRLEEQGSEAFTLHDVFTNPADSAQGVEIARVRVSDLDLAGLASALGPARFALGLEGIAYQGLVEGAEAFGLEYLPALDGPLTLSIATSLLPAGDGRHAARLQVQLDGHFAVAVRAIGHPADPDAPFGAMAMPDMAGEAVELEIQDFGFLRLLLEAQAAEAGMSMSEMVDGIRAGLAEALEPRLPGTPRGQLYDALDAVLANLDGSGMLRLAVSAEDPQKFAELFAVLMSGEDATEAGIRFTADYSPLP
jgi:hypothetical protein